MATKSKPRRQSHGRRPTLPSDARIKILARGNPHVKGSKVARRFAKYANGMTVAQLIEKGGTRSDLKFQLDHGWVKLEKPRAKSKAATSESSSRTAA